MTFQETIAEVLEVLQKYEWVETDQYGNTDLWVKRPQGSTVSLVKAQATLNKDLRERLEKMKITFSMNKYHHQTQIEGFNTAIDKVIQELGLNQSEQEGKQL